MNEKASKFLIGSFLVHIRAMQSAQGEFAIDKIIENRESICQESESLSESIKLENQTITRIRYQYYIYLYQYYGFNEG